MPSSLSNLREILAKSTKGIYPLLKTSQAQTDNSKKVIQALCAIFWPPLRTLSHDQPRTTTTQVVLLVVVLETILPDLWKSSHPLATKSTFNSVKLNCLFEALRKPCTTSWRKKFGLLSLPLWNWKNFLWITVSTPL